MIARPQNEIAENKNFIAGKVEIFVQNSDTKKLNSNSVADILGFLGISPSRENREKIFNYLKNSGEFAKMKIKNVPPKNFSEKIRGAETADFNLAILKYIRAIAKIAKNLPKKNEPKNLEKNKNFKKNKTENEPEKKFDIEISVANLKNKFSKNLQNLKNSGKIKNFEFLSQNKNFQINKKKVKISGAIKIDDFPPFFVHENEIRFLEKLEKNFPFKIENGEIVFVENLPEKKENKNENLKKWREKFTDKKSSINYNDAEIQNIFATHKNFFEKNSPPKNEMVLFFDSNGKLNSLKLEHDFDKNFLQLLPQNSECNLLRNDAELCALHFFDGKIISFETKKNWPISDLQKIKNLQFFRSPGPISIAELSTHPNAENLKIHLSGDIQFTPISEIDKNSIYKNYKIEKKN